MFFIFGFIQTLTKNIKLKKKKHKKQKKVKDTEKKISWIFLFNFLLGWYYKETNDFVSGIKMKK